MKKHQTAVNVWFILIGLCGSTTAGHAEKYFAKPVRVNIVCSPENMMIAIQKESVIPVIGHSSQCRMS